MKDKVDAIFELREAAEDHGRALEKLESEPNSWDARMGVLEAREDLETATVAAIESCHECGQTHAKETACVGRSGGKVVPFERHLTR